MSIDLIIRQAVGTTTSTCSWSSVCCP